MKNFKQFISEEVKFLNESESEGAKMEEIIISSWNNTQPPETIKISPQAGKNIVNFLKQQGVTGSKAYKLKNTEVTSEWAEFWKPEDVPGATKTPKTDIVIGNQTISVKMGNAQLMSGGKREAKATFYAAIKNIPSLHADELAKKIYFKLDQLSELSTTKSGTVEQSLQKRNDMILEKANKVNHEIKNMLQDLFNQNKEFKHNFVYEAMSGDTKFGDSKAKAVWLFSTDVNGQNNKFVKIKNKQLIKKVADATGVDCRFKSMSQKVKQIKTGKYNYFGVVGLITKKLKEEFNYYDGVLLTENIITGIFKKIKDFVTNLLEKVIEWLKGGIKRIMEFFLLEPEVQFNNKINFLEI
jgi:hypothetical protein